MLRKAFLKELYRAADMRRWNDKIRPVELRELDHQAHKMTIAYVLGKYEERENPDVNWVAIIERGIFEFLERIVLTDIKPQILQRIKKEHPEKFKQLREMVSKHFEFMMPDLPSFSTRFEGYLRSSEMDEMDINARIIDAAGFCATAWEWHIIEQANLEDYEVDDIGRRFKERWESVKDLQGISKNKQWVSEYEPEKSPWKCPYERIKDFVNLCGMLRFQERWSHLHRVPRPAVLGHALIVAIFSYLFSLAIEDKLKNGKGKQNQRHFNNFFGGLFHDLPEALTRDIISPVKKGGGIEDIIRELEQEQMEKRIYKPKNRLELIPKAWHREMQKFTVDEFESKVYIDGKKQIVDSKDINKKFYEDEYDPIDGQVILAADHLAAFLEAYLAIQNGIAIPEFVGPAYKCKDKYMKEPPIAGLNFGEVYIDF